MTNHGGNRRRSIRLQGYDYSRPGSYFITICTHNRECLFDTIVDGEMVLNEFGRIVSQEWVKTGEIRDEIKLDRWVIMPNHFHGIVWIKTTGNGISRCRRGDRPGRGTARRAPTVEQFGKPVVGSLPTIVRAFKSAVTKRINQLRNTPGMKLWQRNYWEHIIRNDDELNRLRQYIMDNPMKWETDRENPEAFRRTAMIRENSEELGV